MVTNVKTISEQTRESPVGQQAGKDSLSREEEVLFDLNGTVIIEGPVECLVHNRTALDDLGNLR